MGENATSLVPPLQLAHPLEDLYTSKNKIALLR